MHGESVPTGHLATEGFGGKTAHQEKGCDTDIQSTTNLQVAANKAPEAAARAKKKKGHPPGRHYDLRGWTGIAPIQESQTSGKVRREGHSVAHTARLARGPPDISDLQSQDRCLVGRTRAKLRDLHVSKHERKRY